MLNQLFTTKTGHSQAFIGQKRVPTTLLQMEKQVVIGATSATKDGYLAVKLAIGTKRPALNKPEAGILKAAKITHSPRWIREIRLSEATELQPGTEIAINDIIGEGDLVKATGTSKGKGFSGVIKRHHFHGGPRTHGQSDRARAPGSIGRGTTPGRVVPGQKMAGHMGNVTSSVRNLQVISISQDGLITLKGLVPGANQSLVTLTITKKNPNPPLKEEIASLEEVVEVPTPETQTLTQEVAADIETPQVEPEINEATE